QAPPLVLYRREGACRCERVFRRPQHQCKRCSKLVTDVAEERRLGPIELGQGLRALALFFALRSATDCLGYARRQQLVETSIGGTLSQYRTQPCYHNPHRVARTAALQRKQ